MKRVLIYFVIFLGLGGGIAAAYRPTMDYLKKRNAPKWKTEKVLQGDIVYEVNSTGTIRPVLSVVIGSFVSGPIKECLVDFNDEVQAGELLATVDRRLFEANVTRDEASLATRKAEIARVNAQLQQAINDERRAMKLREINKDYLSDAEMDQYQYGKEALEAQLNVAERAYDSTKAALDNSITNLEYCEIRSPVNGIIIDRKIDPGQTLAATFQTPELFIVAPDLRKEVHVFAQIDETDIGRIRDAAERDQPVLFQVDAYPEEVFTGSIQQIRLSSVQTQNVVTYPVVVSAKNPDLKLLPGMTATLSFQIQRKEKITRIPNSALRFYPQKAWVRKEDQKILEGSSGTAAVTVENNSVAEGGNNGAGDDSMRYSVSERVETYQKQHLRHIWVKDGDKLRAIQVEVGISDHRYTELVSGDVKPGDALIIGMQ